MPTIEFFGYDAHERGRLEYAVRVRLRGEPFREDCVFVERATDRVRGWDGAERPFIRVSTRSPERARRFEALLAGLADLETAIIGFQPNAVRHDRPFFVAEDAGCGKRVFEDRLIEISKQLPCVPVSPFAQFGRGLRYRPSRGCAFNAGHSQRPSMSRTP
jgi:hypothetical protein